MAKEQDDLERRVVALYVHFIEEKEKDSSLTMEAFAKRHPEYEELLHRTAKGAKQFEEWARRLRDRS